MKLIERFVLRSVLSRLFNIDFKDVIEDAINNIKCDTVNIEGLTDYYKTLTAPSQKVANTTFRLILAYLLNRAGIKINYDEIK